MAKRWVPGVLAASGDEIHAAGRALARPGRARFGRRGTGNNVGVRGVFVVFVVTIVGGLCVALVVALAE